VFAIGAVSEHNMVDGEDEGERRIMVEMQHRYDLDGSKEKE